VILFGTATTGLLRVADRGGAPSPVTTLDRSRKEAFHAEPDFLPDGRHFLYGRIGGSEDAFGVYVGSLDAKPEQQSSQRLLENASAAIYAPGSDPASNSGYVLFNREGSLMVQAFDAGRLSLSGVAVPIAEGIGRGGPIKFSVSGTGVLAYRTGIYSGTFLGAITQLTWFDRDGKPLGTAGEPGGYNTVALSPDGSRVAISRSDTRTTLGWRGSYDIWVHEFARGIPTRLTSESASNSAATWSPDGRSVIFSSDRDSPVANLYQKVATGAGNEVLLLKSNDAKYALDCSQDGRFLLFSVGAGRNVGTAPQDLWVLPLTSGKPGDRQPEPYLKTRFNESQGRFSPDSRFIAYTSDVSGRNEIYVQPFPTASGDRVTVSRGGGVAPRWARDGKELFYISDDSKMMAVEVSTDPVFKAGIPKVLFQAPVWGGGISRIPTRYDVTADGKKFLINSLPAEAGAPATSPITVVLNWTALVKK
jgi:Tol biopolymer transport system component